MAIADPLHVTIGCCTSTSGRLQAVFDREVSPELAVARLYYRTQGSTKISTADAKKLLDAAPYALARFALAGLPASSTVEYVIKAAGAAKELPAANGAFQSKVVRSFRLLPTSRPPRIALVSCNGVFMVSDAVRKYAMWASLKQDIAAELVDMVIYAGDQIYADPIWMKHDTNEDSSGLTPQDQVRVAAITEKYRRWYMHTWTAPEIAAVHGSCPSLWMWDDHDIYDGYGSNDDDQGPAASAFFMAAAQAFDEFQGGNNPGPALDSSSRGFYFSPTSEIGVLVVDGRTNRSYAAGRVLGDAQLNAVGEKLRQLVNLPSRLKYLYVVMGIPMVHAPIVGLLRLIEATPWTEEITDDMRDAWISPRNQDECRRLLLHLFRFCKDSPETMVAILAGDVHVGTLARIESKMELHRQPNKSISRIYQIVSSGIGYPAPTGIGGAIIRLAIGRQIDLVGNDITGSLLRLPTSEGGYVLDRRNYAILKTADRDCVAWDPNGNLRVEFIAEGKSGVERFEQVLVRG